MDSVLPGVLAQSPHIASLDEEIRKELDKIDISACMMMMVDTVDAKALPYLAKQFDILGYRGYRLATTDTQRRALIKQAIELKRYMGTVWAVKQAMIAVGYGGATLVEGAGTVGDGHDWARFEVVVNLGIIASLNGQTAVDLAELINIYKNVRSELLSIAFTADWTDYLPLPAEVIDIEYHSDLDDYLFTGTLRLDGSWKLDGSKKLRPGVEDLQVTIL